MRPKLKVFSEFAGKLLPHETGYLLRIQQLGDPVKLSILERAHHNASTVHDPMPFDEDIDKRKYSSLKQWIELRLSAIDVDLHFSWMSELEPQINRDSISLEEEKALLKAIRKYEHPSFYFTKFYELVRQYRHFLLIRMRYTDHRTADDFLRQYQQAYQASVRVNDQLHEATRDIVQKYSENSRESIQWKKWLQDMFFDESLDGFNRYTALVRLIFVRFTYNEHQHLEEVFDEVDRWFEHGQGYSRRILLNYYSNRLLLHTRKGEWDKAIYYGYLSIRDHNTDTLLYVNNLTNVLLRLDRYDEAWNIMRGMLPALKTTRNFHSRIGFVSLYTKVLLKRGQAAEARSYAELYLRGYEKEILLYRWHRFFTTYLETLLSQRQYQHMLQIIRRYGLIKRELQYQSRSDYMPAIQWMKGIAEYHLGMVEKEEVTSQISEFLSEISGNASRIVVTRHFIRDLRPYAPEVLKVPGAGF